jgi:tight adherence protein C
LDEEDREGGDVTVGDSSTLAVGLALSLAGLTIAGFQLITVMTERRQVARALATIGAHGSVETSRGSFGQRVLVPALEQFAECGRRLSPGGTSEALARKLDLAGNPGAWTLERVLAVKALGGLLLVMFGLWIMSGQNVIAGLLVASVLGVVGFVVPDLLVTNAGAKRQDVIRRELADALDLLTISVEAGLSFDAAIAQVARNTAGPFSGECYRVLQEMQIGKSRSEAFRALGERSAVPELKTFVSALVQADKLGIPIGRVLREQTKEMRLKRRQRAEEKAMKVPVKMLLPMAIFILPVLFVVALGPPVLGLLGNPMFS